MFSCQKNAACRSQSNPSLPLSKEAACTFIPYSSWMGDSTPGIPPSPGDVTWAVPCPLPTPHPRAQPALSSLSLSVCRMETFPAVAEEVLREFQVLLQHSPPPIGSTRMLQLVAINMFAVYNSQPKGTTCCLRGNWMGISRSPCGEGWGGHARWGGGSGGWMSVGVNTKGPWLGPGAG